MKAKELIEILQQNPELEVVVCECKKYEDNIPLIPVNSAEIFSEEDSEEDKIILKFNVIIKTDKLDLAVSALKKMARPIKYLREEAENEGMQLNGAMAVQLTEKANFYQNISFKTLEQLGISI